MAGSHTSHPVSRDTLLTGAGRQPLAYHGAVNVPVIRTSTVFHRTLEDYEAHRPDDWRGMLYGRAGTPTTFALEEAVARMEGGHDAIASTSPVYGSMNTSAPRLHPFFNDSSASL